MTAPGRARRVRAEGDVAGVEIAAEPPGAADRWPRARPRQHLLEERAAQGLLGLVARLGHRHLGEGRDRRHVQVVAGVGATAP